MTNNLPRAGALLAAAVVAVALAGVPSPAGAQSIGEATDVDRTGWRAAAGSTVREEIAQDGDIFLQDRLSTDGSGRMRIAFDDNSILVVGPDSRLTIDEFVYAGDGGSLVGSLTVGGFRFLSGDMPSSSYRIETPTAVVGLRGTDVVVLYNPFTRETILIVLSGEGWISPLGLLEQFTVLAGQTAAVGFGGPPVIRPGQSIPDWSRVTTQDPRGNGNPQNPGGGGGGGSQGGTGIPEAPSSDYSVPQ